MKFQLKNQKFNCNIGQKKGYHLSLATTTSSMPEPTPEDLLLEQTRQAMQAQPDWGVGCKTQRKGA